MRVVGLTGGIASGKSTVARMFAALGAKLVDADLLAREVVAPGTPGFTAIATRWPEVIVNGQLDRKALGKKVYADPLQRAELNAITHPLIAAEAAARMQALAGAGEKVGLYEAALIVENNLDAGMDGLIVVNTPPEVQLQRLMTREKMSEADARVRLSAQASLEEKLRRATWVIDNSGDEAKTRAQVEETWRKILGGGVMSEQKNGKRTFFVTGFPGFIGKRLAAELCRSHPGAKLYLLVQPKFLKDAKRYLRTLPEGADAELLAGDIVDMHLGLSSQEYNQLCEEVTDIHHLAAISYLGVPKPVAHKVNVEGTRNLLELAGDAQHLRRFNHFSTCYVSGDRVGVIAEDELDLGQAFRNAYEETKFQAEKLVRRAHERGLPTTIYRPSIVVGDSKTGEIDRFDGPYYLGILLVTSPLSVPLPLPGNGVAPLNVVPVDFVTQAVSTIADDPRAVGRTFHLVDPNPMSSRRVYELIAEKANKRMPKITMPHRAADALMRLPYVEKLVRPQRAAVSYVNHLAIYNCHNTLELLDGRNVRCPPLTSYLDTLVSYVRKFYRQRQQEVPGANLAEDPLDVPESRES